MMGTVWVRLKTEQDYIQSFVNAIVSLCAPRVLSIGNLDVFLVLRLGIHVFHGSSIRARLPGGSCSVYQGSFQRPVRATFVYDHKLHNRLAVSL